MALGSRRVAKALRILVYLALINNASFAATWIERQSLQGSFNDALQSSHGRPARDTADRRATIEIDTTSKRVLLQNTRESQSELQSPCGLSSEEIERFYDATSRQWLLNDDVLEALDSDVQAIIECANKDDVLLLNTSQTIKPARTLVLSTDLTIATLPRDNGDVVSTAKRVTLTCPNSGQLLITRSTSFTLRNLEIKDCNSPSSIVMLEPICDDQEAKGSARFLDLAIERNVVSGQRHIMDAGKTRCSQVEFNNVSLLGNRCSGSCVLLSSVNRLTNIQLLNNEESDDSSATVSIFSAFEDSKTIATNIISRRNEIRSFHVFKCSLNISDSDFDGNGRTQLSVTIDSSIGGGVLFSNHSSVFISNTKFERNYALNGGGVFAWSSNITINDCIFKENDSGEGNGGALYSHHITSFNVSSSEFSKNRGYRGAGLHSYLTREVNIVNSKFIENYSSRSCAVSIYNGTANVESSEFLQNTAELGGAAFCTTTSKLSLKNSTFNGNIAGVGGACVFQLNSTVDALDLLFENNTARVADGGGVYFTFSGRMTLTDSVFQNNHGRRVGGAILTGEECKTILKRVVFLNNTSDEHAGAILISKGMFSGSDLTFKDNRASRDGGAIYFSFDGRLSITDSEFQNNYCQSDGGAIFAGEKCETILRRVTFFNNTSGDHAGAVHIWRGNFSGSDLTFRSNRAKTAAGSISFFEANTVSVSRSYFQGNRAAAAGAIQFFSTTSGNIYQCTFFGNVGQEGPGGAIQAMQRPNVNVQSHVTIQSSLFRTNKALFGGSLSLIGRCNSTILDSRFEYNFVESGGGAINAGSSTLLLISNSYFKGNRGPLGGALNARATFNISISKIHCLENLASSGGCLYLYDHCGASITESVFTNNTAEHGGAIDLLEGSSLSMSNSKLVGNRGGDLAGAVLAFDNSTVYLDVVQFRSNEADRGGALHLSESCIARISACIFTNNTAADSGGAINIIQNSTMFLTNSSFSENKADQGGGLYVWNNNTVMVFHSSFARHSASTFGGAIYLQESNMFLMSIVMVSNSAMHGGSLAALSSSLDMTNSAINGSVVGEKGGGMYLNATHARLETTRLESNEAVNTGGGIAVVNVSSLLCFSCLILNNKAFSGAGLYVEANNSILIAAQFQNSRFQNNSAESYGGAIEFAGPQKRSLTCNGPNLTCSHILLLNTDFKGNYAGHSGAVVLTSDPQRVLITCKYEKRRNQDFLEEKDLNSLKPIDPKRLCSSWKRNRVSTNAYGDAVGTYGQKTVLTVAPNTGPISLTMTNRNEYLLENVRSGRQLPPINVTIFDGYDVGPAPTIPHTFEARISSLDGFFNGFHNTQVFAGIGNFSRVIGLAHPGTYTLRMYFENDALETLTVFVIVRECQIGEEPTRDGLTCQECDAFSYNFNASEIGGCKECPEHATCRGRYIVPKKGHWHKSPCHETIQRCLVEEACTYKDRSEVLTNSTQNSTECNINKTSIDSYNDALCNEGYKGLLCGSCKKSFGLSMRFLCLKCPKMILSILTLIGVALYLLGAAFFTIRGCIAVDVDTQSMGQTSSQSPKSPHSSNKHIEVNNDIVEKMVEGNLPQDNPEKSQTLNTSQTKNSSGRKNNKHELTRWRTTEIFKTTAVAANVNVQWSDGVVGVFESSEYLGVLSTAASSGPIDCIISSDSPETRSIWRMLLTLLIPGSVISFLFLFWACMAYKRKKNMLYLGKRSLLSIVAVIYISYLGLTQLAVRVFYCVDVYDSVDPLVKTKSKHWAVDTAVTCYERTHVGLIIIAAIVLLLVSLGFPLISAVVLTKAKAHYRESKGWQLETMGFLYRAFKEEFVYWESLVMLRKALLSIIVVFAYPLGGQIQGLLAALVIVFGLYFHLICAPFRQEFSRLNYYESISLLVSCVTFILGQFFNAEKSSNTTRILITIVIIAATTSFFVCMMLVLVRNIIEQLREYLKDANMNMSKDAPWWKVIEVYISSRVSASFRSKK